MRFDVVIVGGGLAGLAAALRLQTAGRSCAIVNAGQSALHFSSGAIDLLGFLPDGGPVTGFPEALKRLALFEPEHPYALMGVEKVVRLAQTAEALLHEWGIPLRGAFRQGNHYRVTPFGKLQPTWLSSPDVLGARGTLPWKKVLLANIEGFLDFYPEILAENLSDMGIFSRQASITVPDLERLRENPSEFRSINIARVLDLPENVDAFIEALIPVVEDSEAVILPACIGHREYTLTGHIESRIGRPVRLVPTLPPSLVGARLSRMLAARFTSHGGVLMPGDRAVGYALEKGRIARIFTANHEDIPLEADAFLLASGGFFSQGLRSDMNGVREPVFMADLLPVPDNRDAWTARDVFDPQPYARFGVRTDACMRVFLGGRPVPNLYAAGMILGGYDAVRLGCGGGVALTTALAAAEAILGEGRAA